MKKIKFTCSNCQAKLRVPTHLAGVTAPCPKCGHKITAPTDYESIVDEAPEKTPVAVGAPQRTRVVTATAKAVSSPSAHQGNFSPAMGEAPTTRRPQSEREQEIAPIAPIETRPEPSLPPVVSNEVPPEDSGPALPPPILEEKFGEKEGAEAPVSLPPLDLPPETMEAEPLFPPSEEIGQPDTTVSELPEPAAPDTQPIRVSARPDHLPEVRPVRDEETGSLPRLDISLGEAASSGGKPPASLASESQEKTRLHLPQPGDLANDEDLHQFSPDDFIIPSDGGVEQPREELPEEPRNDFEAQTPSAPEPVEAEIPPAPEESLFPDEEESDLTEVLFNSEPTPPDLQASLGMPDFSQEETTPAGPPEIPMEPVSSEPAEMEQSEPLFPSPGDIPEEEPSSQGSLNEGSFEKLFAQQSANPPEIPPGVPAATVPDETVTIPVSEVPQTTENQGLPIPNETVPVAPSRSESDVLDEMFGTTRGESKGMSKSTVVMLCSIGAVVIIATVLVIVIGMAFGGFSVPEPGEADSQEDATSMLMAKKDKEEAEKADAVDPSIDDAPAVIDPVATERVEETGNGDSSSQSSSTVTLPGDTERPVMIVDQGSGAPATIPKDEGLNDVVEEAKRAIQGGGAEDPTAVKEPTALSFDDALDQFGGSTSDPSTSSFTDAGSSLIDGNPSASAGMPSAMPLDGGGVDAEPRALQASPAGEDSSSAALSNYNPPESFAAPGPDEGPLVRINDLIDAFLRAPDWQTRLKYCFNAESLRPAIEEYYQKWPDKGFVRFSQQMFQMELDKEMGGPYWVYLISTSDEDQGFPLIIRVEDGNLKVDWEIFAEFNDRHFAKFLKGEMPNPGTYRVVLERKSDYYGTDRDAFTTLDQYNVYEVNAPYGALNEFSGYAFVKKDSPVAKELDAVLGLNDEPLAVIATLERVNFEHGTKHMVINEYVTEGWFQN